MLTKGADYKTKRAVVGWDLVRKWGGRVELVPLIEGRSTTGLVRRAQELGRASPLRPVESPPRPAPCI